MAATKTVAGMNLPEAAFVDATAPLGLVDVAELVLDSPATRVPLDLGLEVDIPTEVLVGVDIFIVGSISDVGIFIVGFMSDVDIIMDGFTGDVDITIEGSMAADGIDICARPRLARRRAGVMIVLRNMVDDSDEYIANFLSKVKNYTCESQR